MNVLAIKAARDLPRQSQDSQRFCTWPQSHTVELTKSKQQIYHRDTFDSLCSNNEYRNNVSRLTLRKPWMDWFARNKAWDAFRGSLESCFFVAARSSPARQPGYGTELSGEKMNTCKRRLITKETIGTSSIKYGREEFRWFFCATAEATWINEAISAKDIGLLEVKCCSESSEEGWRQLGRNMHPN